MKAAVLAGCPQAVLVDVTHDVPAFDITAGAFVLFAGTRHFAPGSVHLAVVDPGVGTDRRRLAMRVDGRYYVGPDNGLFAIVVQELGLEAAVELALSPGASPTFEGRDVFAPAAAALAAGASLELLGVAAQAPKPLGDSSPRILWVDGFGNLVTNVKPPARPLRVHEHEVRAVAATYAEAPPKMPFVYLGSMGYLEIGLNADRADRMLGAKAGMRVDLL